jgi:hypothetical protein
MNAYQLNLKEIDYKIQMSIADLHGMRNKRLVRLLQEARHEIAELLYEEQQKENN